MPRSHVPTTFRMLGEVVQLNLSLVPYITFRCFDSKSYVHHRRQDDAYRTSRDSNIMRHHGSYATISKGPGDRLIRDPANATNVRALMHPQSPKYRTHAAPVSQKKQDTT